MRKYIALVILLSTAFLSFSQNNDLTVKSGPKGLFIEHKVGAKESIYSIGRQFRVHPKYLAAYNKLDMAQGLTIGQQVNIPLSDTNLNRNNQDGQPVYYQSSLKQTTGSISALTRTSSSNIRKWNNLAEDNIPASTKIVIGYLLAGDAQTPVAETPKEQQPVASVVTEEKKTTEAIANVKKEEIKEDAAVKTAAVKEEIKPAVQDVQHASQIISADGEGFFKTHFSLQIKSFPLSKEEMVTTGIFKTTSGWNDAKFYALIDGVEPGTIIRVINPENSKVIFAKVLGQMSGIRQNEGYNLRISNAAAAVLQVSETDKFIVKVNY